jgi:hypothetical protein
MRVTSSHSACGVTMRHEARLSSAVPQSTAFFAARVHGHVAADARGLGGRGVDREHVAGALGGVGHALGDDAGFGPDGGHGVVEAGQRNQLDLGHGLELLGVDDHALPGERDRAAGVAGAAAARDDGEAQLDAALDEQGHLGLGVRAQHHEGIFDAPVGGVGDVRDAREAVELDVVLGREAAQYARGLAAQGRHVAKGGVEGRDGLADKAREFAHELVARQVAVGGAALLDFGQAVPERIDQLAAAARVVEQVVDEVGVALDHPDVAEHFVEHARRPAGAALGAQGLEQFPAALAQQADHDLSIGKAGVVIGDLAQSYRLCGLRQQRGQRGRSIHRGWHLGQALRAHLAGGGILGQGRGACLAPSLFPYCEAPGRRLPWCGCRCPHPALSRREREQDGGAWFRVQNSTRLRIVPFTLASFSSARSEYAASMSITT